MKLLVSLEHHFRYENVNGKEIIYSHTGIPASFFNRYFDLFDKVVILARARRKTKSDNVKIMDNCERIELCKLPDYYGPLEYLFQLPKLKSKIKKYINDSEAIILRMPGSIGVLTAKICDRMNVPYSIELVGDPYAAYSPAAIRHILSSFFRWKFTKEVKYHCKRAMAISYVTENYLQSLYPANDDAFNTNYSSVEINASKIKERSRYFSENLINNVNVITIGSLSIMYKGIDTLIDSIKICIEKGVNINLTIVGGGKYENYLMNYTKGLGIDSNISFKGYINNRIQLLNYLDNSEVFILASRQEGLPRAMIEAMARGLPCIGTNVGGIPELLQPQYIVPRDDPEALAMKIIELVQNTELLNSASKYNLQKAQEYTEEKLRLRRIKFYQYVKEQTEEWLKNKNYHSSKKVSLPK